MEVEIVEAKISDLDLFFEYLTAQLLGNVAEGSALFQPVSRQHSVVTEQLKSKFRDGFNSELGSLNWRKLWLARDTNGNIRGHIDLRHHAIEYSFHRVLLGMGVEINARKQGLGERLVKNVTEFCYESNRIDYLDLNVLSENLPARNLYLKCGFKVLGETPDYYRIDGRSVSEITMSICTKNQA